MVNPTLPLTMMYSVAAHCGTARRPRIHGTVFRSFLGNRVRMHENGWIWTRYESHAMIQADADRVGRGSGLARREKNETHHQAIGPHTSYIRMTQSITEISRIP
jgi:hypothetical protein